MAGGVAMWEGFGLSVFDEPCKRSVNPFAPITSLVLRDLFLSAESSRGPVPITQMAVRTELDTTSINRIAGCLAKRGFALRRQYRLELRHRERVLEQWVKSWDGALQVTMSYHVGLGWKQFAPALVKAWHGLCWAWTGAAAATLVEGLGVPLQRVCYVSARHEAQARERLKRLMLPAVDDGRVESAVLPAHPEDDGLFHIVIPMCERSQFYGSRWVSGGPVVSTLQMMLDLERGPGGSERRAFTEAARRALSATLLRGDVSASPSIGGVPDGPARDAEGRFHRRLMDLASVSSTHPHP